MKLFVKSMLLCIGSALLSVGCMSQQQVQLEALFPAKADIPDAGALAVVNKSPGKMAGALQRSFSKKLALVYDINHHQGENSLFLVIDNVIIRCDEVGGDFGADGDESLNARHERRMQNVYPCSMLCVFKARVSLVHGGQVIWSRSHCVEVLTPPFTCANASALCEMFVADLYPYLAPHREPYTVKVNLCGASAELRQAVDALHRKDYAVALQLARVAHSKTPQAPEPIYLIGLLARHYGDYPASTALFKKAYALKEDERYMEAQKQNLELYAAEYEARIR